MTELYADAVRTLSRWRAPTDGQRALQADFVELLAARDDALRRSCVPAHITASTLVMDGAGEAVLLALHRKVGRWLQLGGHCEDGDLTLAGAALREAVEESGIPELRLLPAPIDLDRHAAPCAPGVAQWHYDVRFVAVSDRSTKPETSAESLDVRWFPADDLPARSSQDLPRLLAAARTALAQEHAGPDAG